MTTQVDLFKRDLIDADLTFNKDRMATVVATLKRYGVHREDLRYFPLVIDDCFDVAEFWERVEKYGSGDEPDESLRIRLGYALWVEKRLEVEATAGDAGPVKAADYPYL